MKIRIILLIVIVNITLSNLAGQNNKVELALRSKKNKGFCASFDPISLGYLGITGRAGELLTNGLSISTDCDVSYSQYHFILKQTVSLATQTKTSLDLPNVNEGDKIQHVLRTLAFGYDLKNDAGNYIIPYIGYTWNSSKIWKKAIEDYSHYFKYSGMLIGITWKYPSFRSKHSQLNNNNWEMFNLAEFNFFISNVNTSFLSTGMFYNLSIGYSINFNQK